MTLLRRLLFKNLQSAPSFTPTPMKKILSLGLALVAASASLIAQVTELNVGVRSNSEGWPDVTKAAAAARAEKTRSQTYAILSVSQAEAENGDKLVKPVDAMAVALELERQLLLQGFIKTAPKTKPEVLITGEYGRGFLPNPYQTAFRNPGDMEVEGLQTVNISGADMGQLMRQKENGYEAKLQKAGYEKLYLRVRAWKYPTKPGRTPDPLWTTVMVVDDPDHRDLNVVFKDMLASGAAYFGRGTDKPEVDVFKPLPDGRVDIGMPTMVSGKK
jgi:hypothetical protein